MRTTITIDDELLRAAKQRAAATGKTLSEVVEAALRDSLVSRPARASAFRLRLVSAGRGGVRPGVELSDNVALRDLMDGAG
jgi:hypothetical protein